MLFTELRKNERRLACIIAMLFIIDEIFNLGVCAACIAFIKPKYLPILNSHAESYLVFTGVGMLIALIYVCYSLFTAKHAILKSVGAESEDSVLSDAEETKLNNAVHEIDLATGIPMPQLMVLDSDAPNAMAISTGHGKNIICVTKGLVDANSYDTEAVLANQFAHLASGDSLLDTCTIAIESGFKWITILALLMLGIVVYPTDARDFSRRRRRQEEREAEEGHIGKANHDSAVDYYLTSNHVLGDRGGFSPIGWIGDDDDDSDERNNDSMIIVDAIVAVLGLLCFIVTIALDAMLTSLQVYKADIKAIDYTRNPDEYTKALQDIGKAPTLASYAEMLKNDSNRANPRAMTYAEALFFVPPMPVKSKFLQFLGRCHVWMLPPTIDQRVKNVEKLKK